MKKLTSMLNIILCVILILNCSVNVRAAESKNILGIIENESEEEAIAHIRQVFETMTIEELNSFIDTVAKKGKNGNKINGNKGLDPVMPTVVELKAAWLAAAQVAKSMGYTCSAKLVEYSVLGLNYNESKGSGGLFHDKIVASNVYKNYIYKIQHGILPLGVGEQLTHIKSDNADLYYSLHTCTYTTTKTNGIYRIAVYDKFDFDVTKYSDIFTATVNNWAYLCQQTWVLYNITVNISFNS